MGREREEETFKPFIFVAKNLSRQILHKGSLKT